MKEQVLTALTSLMSSRPSGASASEVYVALLKAQVRTQYTQVVAELNKLVAEGVAEQRKLESCGCPGVWWLKKN